MTFPEFQSKRKRVTAAEMKRAGLTPNEQTQYGWLYPGNLNIESTVGWDDEWRCFTCSWMARSTSKMIWRS